MKALLTVAAVALSLSVMACSDDGDSAVQEPTPDAGFDPDTIAEACAVEPDFGDIGLLPAGASFAVRSTNDFDQEVTVTYVGALNDDQDQLMIQLWRGFGVFSTTSIGTGRFVIQDDELDYATCGVCVLIKADRPNGTGDAEQVLMATGGTLDVIELGPTGSGKFKAVLSNATFEHVEIAATTYASTPVGDGCTSSIGNLVADVPITAPMP